MKMGLEKYTSMLLVSELERRIMVALLKNGELYEHPLHYAMIAEACEMPASYVRAGIARLQRENFVVHDGTGSYWTLTDSGVRNARRVRP